MRVPVGIFYEMKVYIRRIILILDRPRYVSFRRWQVGRIIINKELYDCD